MAETPDEWTDGSMVVTTLSKLELAIVQSAIDRSVEPLTIRVRPDPANGARTVSALMPPALELPTSEPCGRSDIECRVARAPMSKRINCASSGLVVAIPA